jgi:hypothetical protein
MGMDFDETTDLSTAEVSNPLRDPLSTPISWEVKVLARYVHIYLVVVWIDKHCELCCSLSELASDVSFHMLNYFISIILLIMIMLPDLN